MVMFRRNPSTSLVGRQGRVGGGGGVGVGGGDRTTAVKLYMVLSSRSINSFCLAIVTKATPVIVRDSMVTVASVTTIHHFT